MDWLLYNRTLSFMKELKFLTELIAFELIAQFIRSNATIS